MNEMSSAEVSGMPPFVKRTSWAAIFAGVVVTLIVQLMLSLLGLGIGLSTIDPMTEQNPVAGIGIGSGIWFAVSTLIALYLGGWVAGHLAGMPRKIDSALHGAITWGIATLLTFYFMTTAIGGIVSGTANIVGRGLGLAGQGAGAIGPQVTEVVRSQLQRQGIDLSGIKNDAQALLRGGGGQELAGLVDRVFSNGGRDMQAGDRQQMVNILVSRGGMTPAEANTRIDQWQSQAATAQQRFEHLQVEARESADKAAAGLSKAAIWGFFGLLLGAVAATFGGMQGMPRDTIPPEDATRGMYTRERPAFQG